MATFIQVGQLKVTVGCEVERMIETYIMQGYIVSSTGSFEVEAGAYLCVLMRKGKEWVRLSDHPLPEAPSRIASPERSEVGLSYSAPITLHPHGLTPGE